MKTKFFTLFAAMMLLFGAKAMAQTNGDVNEDGVVNEQDITAIIQIMQEAGGVAEATKYYWYVGQTQPTADNYTTLEGIQQVTDYPTTFEYTNNSGKRGYAYVILHNSKTLTAVEKVSQATVNFTTDTSIPNYTIYKSTAGMAINGVMVITVNEQQTEDTKYYWYVGNTSPEGMTPPSVGNANSTLCQWTSLGTSLPTTSIKVYKEDENYDDHTWYVAAPTAAGFVLYDALNSEEELGYKKTKTFMIGNVSYDLWVRQSQGDQAFVWLHK